MLTGDSLRANVTRPVPHVHSLTFEITFFRVQAGIPFFIFWSASLKGVTCKGQLVRSFSHTHIIFPSRSFVFTEWSDVLCWGTGRWKTRRDEKPLRRDVTAPRNRGEPGGTLEGQQRRWGRRAEKVWSGIGWWRCWRTTGRKVADESGRARRSSQKMREWD